MNIVYLILSLIFIVIFIINQLIKYSRFTKINNMNRIYDEMEFYFIKNKITITNNHIELLKRFKNLVVNPDFLDIKFLLSVQIAMKKNNIEVKNEISFFDASINTMDVEFVKIFKEFDKNANDIVRISMFKPDFIYFTAKVFILHILKSKIRNPIAKMKEDYIAVINHEESIAYSYKKLNLA